MSTQPPDRRTRVGPLDTSSRNEPSGSATVRDEDVVAPSTATSVPVERASADADASSIADTWPNWEPDWGPAFDGPPDVAEAAAGTNATAEVMTRVNAARLAAALRTAGRRPESR
ncbi:hypothetical protein GCM10023193_38780 [Planotetraspora kaengkrachanensis]|uniref:Uncharacterized protein n=1 Tax=Planotetraspora kaengkrachanensis TaxID=575193 RepID=A0A8J3LVJ4_9ACTN|nr:hypothetical protein Pka01_22740 [Planotetraspora kaengkrachanensis]